MSFHGIVGMKVDGVAQFRLSLKSECQFRKNFHKFRDISYGYNKVDVRQDVNQFSEIFHRRQRVKDRLLEKQNM